MILLTFLPKNVPNVLEPKVVKVKEESAETVHVVAVFTKEPH
jgi:hypothetical protein